MNFNELKEILEENAWYFNQPSFIPHDPVSIPHQFENHKDIEIAGFLSATLAWGQRQVIIRNAGNIVEKMPGGPHDFLLNASERNLETFIDFKHRTFNGTDCMFFLRSLQNIYRNHKGLRYVFENGFSLFGNIPETIRYFRNIFFSISFPERTLKHIPDIDKGSAAKRINMFLRWMVRKDQGGVDFGLWEGIPASALYIPLDLHSGNVARELGLLKRKMNDWKAVIELTSELQKFDPEDPVKYDFALFGMGLTGSTKREFSF